MTTGAISGAGSPLTATGEKGASTSEKGVDTEDVPAPPPSVAPVPTPSADAADAEYSTMMRRTDGAPADPMVVARESRGGILESPTPGERLEDPDQTLICNVLSVSGPQTGRSWGDSEDFLRKLAAGLLDLAQIQSSCDLLNIAETRPYTEETIEAQAIDHFRYDTAPGYYLFFRRNDRDNFDGRHVGDAKTFASLAELRAALADTKYMGDETVGAFAAPLSNDIRQELAPSVPAVRQGLLPTLRER
ncbi:MAG TPA: hypothetical protein VFX30_10960 [bacterium]|nr:hypothetical protein [bacterium]